MFCLLLVCCSPAWEAGGLVDQEHQLGFARVGVVVTTFADPASYCFDSKCQSTGNMLEVVVRKKSEGTLKIPI